MNKYLYVLISLALGVGIVLQSCTDENLPTSPSDATDLEAYSQSVDNPANKVDRQNSDLYWFPEFVSGVDPVKVEGARATLLRTRSNVRKTIKTSGLDPHGTYTVW